METVSIIVPVFNSEKTIRMCIDSLVNLDFPKNKLEIIFVDDGSTDKTKKIIRDYENVELIEQNHDGPASARNNGVKNSHGKYIFFTDSDCIVPDNWIKRTLAELVNDVVLMGGGLKPFSLKTSSEIFEQKRREILYGKKRRYLEYIPSCNMAMKRYIFEMVGGFDESFKYPSFEDYDLCNRIRKLGYKILYEPKIEVIHLHSATWKGVFKRAIMHGREGVKFRFNNKIADNEILLSNMLFILPRTIKQYPRMFFSGFIYEMLSIVGTLIGLKKYRS